MRVMILVLVLVMVSIFNYGFIVTEQPERQAVFADRFEEFSEASGFDGVFIADETWKRRIQRVIGNFPGITISETMPDTLLIQVFEDIVSGLLPIIQARIEPRFVSLTRDNASITATFKQQVNGFDMGQGGNLLIKYYYGRQYFESDDHTYSFDTSPVEVKITREDAIDIWEQSVSEDFMESSTIARIAYYDTNINPFSGSDIKLCWLVSGVKYCLIDALSGEVYLNRLAPYGYIPLD